MPITLKMTGLLNQVPVTSLPRELDDYALPGSLVSGFISDSAVVVCQQVDTRSLVFAYIVASTKGPATLCLNDNPGLFFMLLMEGKISGLPLNYYKQQAIQDQTLPIYLNGGFSRLVCLFASYAEGTQSTLAPATPKMAGLVYTLLHTPYIRTMEEFYQTTLQMLLAEILSAANTRQTPLYSEDVVHRLHEARLLIEKHLDTHLTISQLALRTGLNRQLLKQGFKALYAEGPYACLLRLRLERARGQLIATRRPLKQIARQAGYHDASNFSRAFKRLFGDTPFHYRKKER